jgi:hypothetical protein
MMNLMDNKHWWEPMPKRPSREALRDLGWTSLSVAAALVLLPAIGLRALAHKIQPTEAGRADAAAIWCPGCPECM